VDYLNGMDGIKASLAGPSHLSIKNGKVCCRGEEATVIFMDFNMNVLLKIGEDEDISPIIEAVHQGILVNPRGMEPLGAKGLFEAITGEYGERLAEDTTRHTPWTRQFFPRSTTGPDGQAIEDLILWTEKNWENLVLKPAHGYSGHGIFVGFKEENPRRHIQEILEAGDYIVQQLVPLGLWSEQSTWPLEEECILSTKEWQTDFRCFITDEGLQGFLARFGGVPTNVGSGGGIQPIAILKTGISPQIAVDRINGALMKLGYQGYVDIQNDINKDAVKMGFTYLLGPIMVSLRPRLLTMDHVRELKAYALHLWRDAVAMEEIWRNGRLDPVVKISSQERDLAMRQPWGGSPALMVSDGLFSFGADLVNME
jgi:hypothetical protein